MRILFYSPNHVAVNGPGGIGTYIDLLSRTLVTLGHEARVLVPGAQALQRDYYGVQLETLPQRYMRGVDKVAPGLRYAWQLRARVRALANDGAVDVCEFPNWEGHGFLAVRSNDVPSIVRLSTTTSETVKQEQLRLNWRLRSDIWRESDITRNAGALVSHSASHAKRVREETRSLELQIAVVPLAVEAAARRPARQTNSVVYVGRLEARKGTADLIRAIPLVLSAKPDAKFFFVGKDRPQAPGAITYERFAQQVLPPDQLARVRFMGQCDDQTRDGLTGSANVFVAPSLYESFGLVFLEAMRWGVPVIGTTAGAIPEVVEHGKTGWLVPPNDPAGLAAAILGILVNPGLANELGTNALKAVQTRFSPQALAERSLAAYDAALARRRRH